MSAQAYNNSRIAKNTVFLYVRMLFLMLISLYTSRVVLNALGVEDYGSDCCGAAFLLCELSFYLIINLIYTNLW